MVLNLKPSWNCFDQHMMHQGWDLNYVFFFSSFKNVEWRVMSHILQYKYKLILLYLILVLKAFVVTFKNNFIRLNISIKCFKLGMKIIYFSQFGMN